MNIEVGKYYRMRCGGAVRIERRDLLGFLCAQMVWHKSGKAVFGNAIFETSFDLVAEITEAEYNAITNGWYEELKAERDLFKKSTAHYQNESASWKQRYCDVYDKLWNERRFEAAKAAMQGLLSRGAVNSVISNSLECADALLKSLEEKE